MSGITPVMASAPRMAIRLNSNNIAYAIGLNLSISNMLQPVYVCGKISALSLEPTGYAPVAGTLQIIRLSDQPAVTTANLDKLNANYSSTLTQFHEGYEENVLGQSLLHEHLNPAKILISQSFDIDVYLTNGQSSLNKDPSASDNSEDYIGKFITVRNCRITGRNTNIALGQLVNEPLSFQGLLAISYDVDGNELQQSDFVKEQQ